jgi:outer membrane immunogenic protein
MLRRILLASAGVMELTGAALAADLPSRTPPPVYLPPPICTWTGLYIGINAGYHFGDSSKYNHFSGTDTDSGGLGTALSDGAIPTTGAGGADGAIAGGTIGYNWQINSFVLGVEVDVDGAGGRKTSTFANTPDAVIGVPLFTTSSQGLDWLGTVRGRLGFAIDRLLFFGTGGLAFGESRASFSVSGQEGVPPLSVAASSNRSVGWAVGGGIEYALPYNCNWSVKVEYLHYDLGRTTETVFYSYPVPATDFSTLTGQTRHSGNIVRAGLNYKFDWGPGPVVVKY